MAACGWCIKVSRASRPSASCGNRSRRPWRRKTEFMKTRLLFIAAAVLIAAFASGCAQSDFVRVKPWERATLADYTMRPDRDPLQTSMVEHRYFSRETATGGRG